MKLTSFCIFSIHVSININKLDPADDKIDAYLQKPAFMFTLTQASSNSFMDPLHCLLWLPTINAEQGSSPVNLLTAV